MIRNLMTVAYLSSSLLSGMARTIAIETRFRTDPTLPCCIALVPPVSLSLAARPKRGLLLLVIFRLGVVVTTGTGHFVPHPPFFNRSVQLFRTLLRTPPAFLIRSSPTVYLALTGKWPIHVCGQSSSWQLE